MELGLGFLLPLIGNIIGGIGANQQASAANAIANQQVGLQRKMVDYLLNKRKNVYDPLTEDVVLPSLKSRATSAPFYASDALAQARSLRQPMRLSY